MSYRTPSQAQHLKRWARRCHSPGPRNLYPMQETGSSSGQGPMRTSSGPAFYLDLHSHHLRNRSDSGFLLVRDTSQDSIPPGLGLRRLGLTRAPRRPHWVRFPLGPDPAPARSQLPEERLRVLPFRRVHAVAKTSATIIMFGWRLEDLKASISQILPIRDHS